MGDRQWLKGLFPPIPTAFDEDGSLRPPPEGWLEFLAGTGLDGVVALGSNGEAMSLTEGERQTWLRAIRAELPPPLRLIAGTGADSTVATIERTLAAADLGAEAALVIAPFYFRRHVTADGLRRHYQAVAKASPIPILIYNIPPHMGYDLGTDWIISIAQNSNLAGIKESSGDLARLPRLRERLGPDFALLTGSGEKLLDALELGADGGIAALANLAPAASVAIRQAFEDRDLDEAHRLQKTIAPLGESLTRGYGVPGMKAGVRLLGFDHGDPRPPLPPLPEAELPRLRGLLQDARLIPHALAS
jgi:dihydrodipicolinate synthase/N-acetylneuraminate lyase